MGLPSEDFIEEYEKKSVEYKSNLRKRLLPELEKFEKLEAKETRKKMSDIVLELLENEEIRRELLTKRGKIDIDLLQEKYSLSGKEATIIKKKVQQLMEGKA
jgi:hypothetical protein